MTPIRDRVDALEELTLRIAENRLKEFGDVSGHEFHGNQYGGGGQAHADLMAKSRAAGLVSGEVVHRWEQGGTASAAGAGRAIQPHIDARDAFKAAADSAKAAGHSKIATGYRRLADSHSKFASLWYDKAYGRSQRSIGNVQPMLAKLDALHADADARVTAAPTTVKSELAANQLDEFGDSPGHEFHGNQVGEHR